MATVEKKVEVVEIIQNLIDGKTVELTPAEADELGAFSETALIEEDAKQSIYDKES